MCYVGHNNNHDFFLRRWPYVYSWPPLGSSLFNEGLTIFDWDRIRVTGKYSHGYMQIGHY